MPTLPRPLPPYDSATDSYPTDDYYIEQWKARILTRIDFEWGCDYIIGWTNNDTPYDDYCGQQEHDPFTSRCLVHRGL